MDDQVMDDQVMDDQVMDDQATDRTSVVRWIIAVVAALAIVALLAWARRNPGFDDRVPDPEDAAAAVVVDDDAQVATNTALASGGAS